ncbi:MAG: class I SAM-dependent methyltransferase [Anaerolineae bacterium]|nr:class I SAM-dependent methyltransferase [Anaerolineae bacterium]NUQ06976.1 class I SAM-dependent methyltransferase [Anaerolineae bacterium]
MSDFYRTIARYYDSEHADKVEDLPLYEECAGEFGDPILIIGSGTGRVLLHLADAGCTVHGVEREAAMRERAEAKRAALPHLQPVSTIHAGDVMMLTLPTTFRLVILPYNTFMHFLTLESQQALLRRIRGWLVSDGALIIDLPSAGDAFAGADSDSLILERQFIDGETGRLVMQQSVSSLDRATQNMDVTWIYDAVGDDGVLRRTVAPTRIHYYFLSELRLLLESCGFRLEEVFGDFDRSPFEDGAPRMIVVAR